MAQMDRRAGREAFGADPASYHRARPPYPEAVYDILRERCGLSEGAAVFEVGAGTGTATARLVALGAAPLVAIEPDARLAAYLRDAVPSPDLQIHTETFDDAAIPESAFDLGTAFTAFHWVDQATGLTKAARLLKPGGWWTMAWNVFGDPDRVDPFYEASDPLFPKLDRSPSAGRGGPPFALDEAWRREDLDRTGAFEAASYDRFDWTLVLDPAGVRRLCATYSEIAGMPEVEREAFLDALEDLATGPFQGRVEKHMVTALYTARKL